MRNGKVDASPVLRSYMASKTSQTHQSLHSKAKKDNNFYKERIHIFYSPVLRKMRALFHPYGANLQSNSSLLVLEKVPQI